MQLLSELAKNKCICCNDWIFSWLTMVSFQRPVTERVAEKHEAFSMGTVFVCTFQVFNSP